MAAVKLQPHPTVTMDRPTTRSKRFEIYGFHCLGSRVRTAERFEG
jgi:hypothetical protein